MPLKEQFQEAVKEVFSRIKSAGPSAFSPIQEERLQVSRVPDGGKQVHRNLALRMDARRFVLDQWPVLSRGQAVSALVDSLAASVSEKREKVASAISFVAEGDTPRAQLDSILKNHLAHMTYPAGTAIPDAALVERFWTGLDAILFKDHVPVRESALVVHFDSEVDTIQLAEGIELHRMSDDEITKWAESRIRNFGPMAVLDVEWVVNWDYEASCPSGKSA